MISIHNKMEYPVSHEDESTSLHTHINGAFSIGVGNENPLLLVPSNETDVTKQLQSPTIDDIYKRLNYLATAIGLTFDNYLNIQQYLIKKIVFKLTFSSSYTTKPFTLKETYDPESTDPDGIYSNYRIMLTNTSGVQQPGGENHEAYKNDNLTPVREVLKLSAIVSDETNPQEGDGFNSIKDVLNGARRILGISIHNSIVERYSPAFIVNKEKPSIQFCGSVGTSISPISIGYIMFDYSTDDPTKKIRAVAPWSTECITRYPSNTNKIGLRGVKNAVCYIEYM